VPALVIGNVTAEYSGKAASSLAATAVRKQHAVSTRPAWLLRDGDVMVTSRPLTPEFRRYLARILGIDLAAITFVCPGPAQTGSVFLDPAALDTPWLAERLRRSTGGRAADWSVVPYLHDRAVARLTRRLGLDTQAGAAFFAQGGAEALNRKSLFRAWATGLGVPVAPGLVTAGEGAAAAAVRELLPRTGSVIVKQDVAASGRGNLLITTDPGTPGIGVADTRVISGRLDGPAHGRLGAAECVVEAYYPGSRTLYSELYLPEPPAPPAPLNWGEMRMEPTWNGFIVPGEGLPDGPVASMLGWSATIGEYLQRTGYRGYLNCDSILTASGDLLFSEVNARIGGCTHMHAAATRVLGAGYLSRYTLLTRNNLHAESFGRLDDAIAREELLNGKNGISGALLLVDDVPYTGTVQYLVYGSDPAAAHEAERRLAEVALPLHPYGYTVGQAGGVSISRTAALKLFPVPTPSKKISSPDDSSLFSAR
jgi:hypothetical protein